MHLGYFFFISFILTQQLAWGNGDNVIPQHETSLLPSTASPVLQEGDEGKIRKPTKRRVFYWLTGYSNLILSIPPAPALTDVM